MPDIRVPSSQVPQADKLETVFRVVELKARGAQVTPRTLGVVPRQVAYYTHAAKVLGLLDADGDLTAEGRKLAAVGIEDRLSLAATQFEKSECGRAWAQWCRRESLADVPTDSAERFLKAASDLDDSTARRRAHTMRAWFERLLPCFGRSGSRERTAHAPAVRRTPAREPAALPLDDAPWTEEAANGAVRLQVGMVLGDEGQRKLVEHFLRERDPQVRRGFLAARQSSRRLACDACLTDLAAEYGQKFATVVEVHHTIPVARGVRRTEVEHLALLCPTCHRVAHYRQVEPLGVEEVARLVRAIP